MIAIDLQQWHSVGDMMPPPPPPVGMVYEGDAHLPGSVLSVEHTVSTYSASEGTSSMQEREGALDAADFQMRESVARVPLSTAQTFPMEPLHRGGPEGASADGPQPYTNCRDIVGQEVSSPGPHHAAGGRVEGRGKQGGSEDPLWYKQRNSCISNDKRAGPNEVRTHAIATDGGVQQILQGNAFHPGVGNQDSNDLEDDLFPLPYETATNKRPPVNGSISHPHLPPSFHPMSSRPLPLSPPSQDDDWWSGTVPFPSLVDLQRRRGSEETHLPHHPVRNSPFSKPQLAKLGCLLESALFAKMS